MFRTPQRDVHLHVYEPNDQTVAAYLELRDWLRKSESDRALYASTKRHLAQQPWSDTNHYADAKSNVILAILGRAQAGGAAAHTMEPRWPSEPHPVTAKDVFLCRRGRAAVMRLVHSQLHRRRSARALCTAPCLLSTPSLR